MNANKNILRAVILFSFFILVLGCVPAGKSAKGTLNQAGDNLCFMPEDHNLDTVITNAEKVLVERECQRQFDAIFENILRAGEGDPKPENKTTIRGFLQRCVNKGVFNEKRAREYYGKYFSKSFMCLEDENFATVCEQCKSIPKMKNMLKNEMAMKKRGLLKICKDKETFKKAYHIKQNGIMVMETACQACANY